LRLGERRDDAVPRHRSRHPVSTTHTITGSIIAWLSAEALRGALGRGRQHRLGVVFTIPGSAFIAGVAWWLGTHYF